MKEIKVKKSGHLLETVSLVAEALATGQVVVLPTDTIYGFSCLADNSRAVKRIFKLKGRSLDKPFIVLVASLHMARKYVQFSPKQQALLRKYWLKDARPTTVILKNRDCLSADLNGGRDSLALRLPKSDFLIKIMKKLDRPLVSTSLNISGQADIFNLSDISANWPDKKNQPDLIVNYGRPRRKKPSRIIDLQGIRPVVIRK